MTLKITYKEIILIVGVAVALAIAVIFWYKGSMAPKSLHTSAVSVQKSTMVDLVEKSVPKIFFERLR